LFLLPPKLTTNSQKPPRNDQNNHNFSIILTNSLHFPPFFHDLATNWVFFTDCTAFTAILPVNGNVADYKCPKAPGQLNQGLLIVMSCIGYCNIGRARAFGPIVIGVV
jgi:hypothetical protein